MEPKVALEHSWLSSEKSAKIKFAPHPQVMMNLGRSGNAHELHYELLVLFTQFLNDKDLKDIRETFLSMDEDNTGTIEVEELRDAFESIKK